MDKKMNLGEIKVLSLKTEGKTVVNGKYNTALIYTDDVEEQAEKQIHDLCDDPSFKNSKIRVMPDVHAGKGCTIGTTMTLPDGCVVPNHVGVDIGCGVTALKIIEPFKDLFKDLSELERSIRSNVPSGFNIHEPGDGMFRGMADNVLSYVRKLRFLDYLHYRESEEILERAFYSLGTLGGGNHFIELNKRNRTGEMLLVVHSGSRQLGYKCCQYYQKQIGKTTESERQKLIDDLKRQGRQKEIQSELKKLNDKPKNVLTGKLYDDYIHDIEIVQSYAIANRAIILTEILTGLGVPLFTALMTIGANTIQSVHNYIDTSGDVPVLRKGAISAKKDETVLIPLNMRDGLVIAKGLGNPDWNHSAPHGCGRRMSRSQAFKELSMDEFKNTMKGIYSESVDESTLDEAPSAYKNSADVISKILDETVTDPEFYVPVYNYKHHDKK